MGAIDIVKILLWAIGLWAGIVFLPYMIGVAGLRVKSPTVLAHILYALWFVGLFVYAAIISPLAYLLQTSGAGFYIGLALVVLIVVALVITGVNRKSNRGGK